MSVTPTSLRHLGWLTAAMFLVALVPLLATLGDPGITWDEPVYRESQRLQAEWFVQLSRVRSWDDWRRLVSREATHDLWMSARYGLNFHPPLAGMLSNLTHGVFGSGMHDLNSRRLASALELAAAVAMLFHFLARRYGLWVGAVAGLSLLLTPRVFGHAHIAGTDLPMLFFWASAALAYWKGQTSRGWRVAFAVLVALGFLVKLSTVFVLFPILVWHVIVGGRSGDSDHQAEGPEGSRTSHSAPILSRFVLLLLVAAPLVVAAWEAHRLAEGMRLETQGKLLPYAAEKYFQHLDLLNPGVSTAFPGWILLIPIVLLFALWVGSRALARVPAIRPWVGSVGPGFEMLMLLIAMGPLVVLGLNPGWWRDTLIRIGHYFALFLERRAALPDIEIFYLGQKYVYSLPWHNGWVLIAVTVPLGILSLSLMGVARAIVQIRRDSLPLFFLLNAAALPVSRMLPTPAHDGVRLMLPTFFFLAGLAGIGFGWFANRLIDRVAGNERNRAAQSPKSRLGFKARLTGRVARSKGSVAPVGNQPGSRSTAPPVPHTAYQTGPRAAGVCVALLAVGLGPAVYDVMKIHPYELSYYNRVVGGLSGAWRRGFEVSYWYDAVTPQAVADLNHWLPQGARIEIRVHTDVFGDLQKEGHPPLRQDLKLRGGAVGRRFVFLLTHCSKSNPTTRLLFAQRPAFPPVEQAGVPLFSIYDSAAAARAQALDLLTAAKSERVVPHSHRLEPPALSETVFEIARRNPEAILEGALRLADGRAFTRSSPDDSDVKLFLSEVLLPHRSGVAEVRRFISEIAEEHPNALRDAAKILVERPEVVAQIIRVEGYLPREAVGGYLGVARDTSDSE